MNKKDLKRLDGLKEKYNRDYGVKGMKWGHHNPESDTGSERVNLPTTKSISMGLGQKKISGVDGRIQDIVDKHVDKSYRKFFANYEYDEKASSRFGRTMVREKGSDTVSSLDNAIENCTLKMEREIDAQNEELFGYNPDINPSKLTSDDCSKIRKHMASEIKDKLGIIH